MDIVLLLIVRYLELGLHFAVDHQDSKPGLSIVRANHEVFLFLELVGLAKPVDQARDSLIAYVFGLVDRDLPQPRDRRRRTVPFQR